MILGLRIELNCLQLILQDDVLFKMASLDILWILLLEKTFHGLWVPEEATQELKVSGPGSAMTCFPRLNLVSADKGSACL